MSKRFLEAAVNLGYINQEQALEVCRIVMKSGVEIADAMVRLRMIDSDDLIGIWTSQKKIHGRKSDNYQYDDKEIHHELIERAYAFMSVRAHGNEEKEKHLFVIKTIIDYRANPSDKCPIDCRGNKKLQKEADKLWSLFTKFAPEKVSECMIERIHAIYSDEDVEG